MRNQGSGGKLVTNATIENQGAPYRLPQLRPVRWFWFYVGPCYYADFPLSVSLGAMARPDLMGKGDEGRMVPVLFAFDVLLGPTREAVEDGLGRDPQYWLFRPRFRSEVGEIARRLAGGDE